MKLFFRVSNGPYIHVFPFEAKSHDRDGALEELMSADVVKLCHSQVVQRVIAYDTEERVKPTAEELRWLQVQDLKDDVPKPERAIFDSLRKEPLVAPRKGSLIDSTLVKQIRLLYGFEVTEIARSAVQVDINGTPVDFYLRRDGSYIWRFHKAFRSPKVLKDDGLVIMFINDIAKYL